MTATRARELRSNETKAERKLWSILYGLRRQGYHFRRQQPVGPYFADFACVKAGLVIEVDGATHSTESEMDYDHRRAQFLESKGFRILRFQNTEIYESPDLVFEVTAKALADVPELTPAPVPSPSSGGGVSRNRKHRTGLAELAKRTGSSVRSPSPVGGGDRGGGQHAPDRDGGSK